MSFFAFKISENWPLNILNLVKNSCKSKKSLRKSKSFQICQIMRIFFPQKKRNLQNLLVLKFLSKNVRGFENRGNFQEFLVSPEISTDIFGNHPRPFKLLEGSKIYINLPRILQKIPEASKIYWSLTRQKMSKASKYLRVFCK